MGVTLWRDTESVAENYRPDFVGVRVKTCGKSARPGGATSQGDKPCGLKCYVYHDSPNLLDSMSWVARSVFLFQESHEG